MAKIPVIITIILVLNSTCLHAADHFQPTLKQDEKPCMEHTGNPVLNVSTDITKGKQTRRRLNDTPNWITRVDFNNDGLDEAAILFSDGTMRVLSLEMGNLRTISTVREMAPESAPVLAFTLGKETVGGLVGVDDRGDLVGIDAGSGRKRRLASGFSPVTYPVVVDLDGNGDLEIAAVNDEGFMTVVRERTQVRSNSTTTLLPDTRIAVEDLDGDGTLDIVALSVPTDKLTMARLGDDLEATSLALFSWDGRRLKLHDEFHLPDGQVFESLLPLITCEEDENPVVILVITEDGKGSWLQSFSYSSGRLHASRRGSRTSIDKMIHLIGSARLGHDDRVSVIAAVLGGEQDGDLELYRPDLALKKTSSRSSIYSHIAGSRLVETALIADFNADGMLEILAPADGMSNLKIYSLEGSSLKDVVLYDGSRKITTNLCSGDFDGNGKADVIFGLEDGTLIVLEGE